MKTAARLTFALGCYEFLFGSILTALILATSTLILTLARKD